MCQHQMPFECNVRAHFLNLDSIRIWRLVHGFFIHFVTYSYIVISLLFFVIDEETRICVEENSRKQFNFIRVTNTFQTDRMKSVRLG